MATEESVQAEELQEAPGPSEVRLAEPPALWGRTEWSTASCDGFDRVGLAFREPAAALATGRCRPPPLCRLAVFRLPRPLQAPIQAEAHRPLLSLDRTTGSPAGAKHYLVPVRGVQSAASPAGACALLSCPPTANPSLLLPRWTTQMTRRKPSTGRYKCKSGGINQAPSGAPEWRGNARTPRGAHCSLCRCAFCLAAGLGPAACSIFCMWCQSRKCSTCGRGEPSLPSFAQLPWC